MKKYLNLFVLLFFLSPCFGNNGDSLKFELIWEYSTFPFLPQTVVYDQMDRPYFYLAAKAGGLLVFEGADTDDPKLIQTIPIGELANLQVMNAFQSGNYLFLSLGNFVGVNPQEAGFGILDLSDPEDVFIMDIWKTSEVAKGSAIVFVEGDYAYLGAMTEGLMIFDISDKENIVLVSQYVPDIHFPVSNPTPTQTPNARGMDIQNNLLYLCYDAGGIRVIDVSDKENPVEISRYINESVLGKQQAYNNVVVHNSLAYAALDYCGLEILDISNPENIKQLAWWNPWGCELPSNNWFNSPGHTNQLIYIENENLIFLSAGGSELEVVDVANPEEPVSCCDYGEPGNQLGVWGVAVHKQRVFLTYINAFIPFFSNWSGVKILDWEVVTGVEEVGPEKSFLDIENFPNPFFDRTKIRFELKETSEVSIEIYTVGGEIVFKKGKQNYPGGTHDFFWNGITNNGSELTGGLYFLKITANGKTGYKKLLKI